jgi:hypothetical protein
LTVTLNTLFCSPQDVWDLLSVEGVDLREDDHNQSTGQIIVTNADALVDATTISVAATPVALLRGTVLVFDGGGMSVPVQASLSAAAGVGATSLTVDALAIQINSGARARDSGVNAATGARLVTACRKGTSRVKLYCNGRYDDSQLVLAGTVCDWAATIAAKFLCERRAQGCPKSIKAAYDEYLEELRMVQYGQLAIEDIGTRGSDWPSMSNVIVNPSHDGMRVRVQRAFSEQTPTSYSQFVDWNSAVMLGGI